MKDSKTSQSFWCPSLARQKLQQNTKPPALLTIIKSGNTVYVLIPIYYEGVDCGLESTLHCFTINFFTCISKYFLSFIIICFIYSFSKLLFLFAFKTPMFSKRFTKNIYYEWSKNKTTVSKKEAKLNITLDTTPVRTIKRVNIKHIFRTQNK